MSCIFPLGDYVEGAVCLEADIFFISRCECRAGLEWIKSGAVMDISFYQAVFSLNEAAEAGGIIYSELQPWKVGDVGIVDSNVLIADKKPAVAPAAVFPECKYS